MISVIVAMSENRVIGRAGGMPWHLSADLRRFKAITMGHPIIMGRKTHESIGRVLPGRQNIVVTGRRDFKAEACVVVPSFEAALAVADDPMIIGGATLYEVALERADRLYLTEVHATLEGDTFFPPVNAQEWDEISRERHTADEQNDYDHSFVVLDRKLATASANH